MTATVISADRKDAIKRAEAFAPFLRDAITAFPEIASAFLERGSDAAVAGAERLHLDFAAEPSFNASRAGPLYLAALHR